MRLHEIFNTPSIVLSERAIPEHLDGFWFNPATNDLEDVGNESHTAYAAHTLGFIPDDRRKADITDSEDDEVLAMAIDAGWVRGRYTRLPALTGRPASSILQLQGKLSTIWRTAVYLASKVVFTKLYIDLSAGSWGRGLVFYGDRLEYFLKRGSVPSLQVQEAAEKSTGLVFHQDVHGFHSGQMDATWIAYRPGPHEPDSFLPGQIVGALDYSEYQGRAHINMIRVRPEEQRKGLGLALVQKLRDEYGNKIDWGMLTDDGGKLKAASDSLKEDEHEINAYHGTAPKPSSPGVTLDTETANIEKFEPQATHGWPPAIYAATDPKHAEVFARNMYGRGAIYPIVVKGPIASRTLRDELLDSGLSTTQVVAELKNRGYNGHYEDHEGSGMAIYDPKNIRHTLQASRTA